MHAMGALLTAKNSSDADSATILFGGIDSQKFFGNLETLPIELTSNGSAIGWTVPASSVFIDNEQLNQTKVVFLDTGSTLTYVSRKVAKSIWDKVEAKMLLGRALIDCKYRDPAESNTTVDFTFGNKAIKVLISELVVKLPNYALVQQLPIDLDDPCVFGIQSTADNNMDLDTVTIIGDTVLRSMYVVYDARNKQVGIAQANVGSSTSEIHELDDGKDFPVSGVSEPSKESSGSSTDKESNAATIMPGWTALISIIYLLV